MVIIDCPKCKNHDIQLAGLSGHAESGYEWQTYKSTWQAKEYISPTQRALLTGYLKDFPRVFHTGGTSTWAIREDTLLTEAIIAEDEPLLDPYIGDAPVEWANSGQLHNTFWKLVTYLKENELIHPKC